MTKKPKEVTAESAIKAYSEAELKIRRDKLKEMVEREREKVAGYVQVAKVHSAYISILLKKLGATEENKVEIKATEITEALEKYEARAIATEEGFALYLVE